MQPSGLVFKIAGEPAIAYVIVDSINVVRPDMLSDQEPERSGLNMISIAYLVPFVN